MEQLTVLLARAGAWVEVLDLNPRGKVFYPALVQALVERYGFQAFPQKLEDYNESKGIEFLAGRHGNTTIEKVVIYTHGVILETRESTDVSRALLEDAFGWAAKDLGLNYRGSQPIRSWQYYSQLTFDSKIQLTSLHPALQHLTDGISNAVESVSGERLVYEPVNLKVDHDVMLRKNPYGFFSLQRREEIPFAEGKYYSDAPIPTDIHIQLLKQFEAEMGQG